MSDWEPQGSIWLPTTADVRRGFTVGIDFGQPRPAESSDPEFCAQPVYGYRTWRMDPDTLHLKAVAWDETWPQREALVSTHHVTIAYGAQACPPGEPCSNDYGYGCGIWAFDDYAHVVKHQEGNRNWVGERAPALDCVRGIVAGWGKRVIICSKGWRAGKAYPLALLNWSTSQFRHPDAKLSDQGLKYHYLMHRIARRYGIPVVESVQELVWVARDMGCVPIHNDPLFEVPEVLSELDHGIAG